MYFGNKNVNYQLIKVKQVANLIPKCFFHHCHNHHHIMLLNTIHFWDVVEMFMIFRIFYFYFSVMCVCLLLGIVRGQIKLNTPEVSIGEETPIYHLAYLCNNAYSMFQCGSIYSWNIYLLSRSCEWEVMRSGDTSVQGLDKSPHRGPIHHTTSNIKHLYLETST